MSELDQAAQRLEQAIARLEAVASRGGERRASAKSSPPSSDTVATVAARLDDAIIRIDRLLES